MRNDEFATYDRATAALRRRDRTVARLRAQEAVRGELVITYSTDITALTEDQPTEFFVGWPRRPCAARHLRALHGSRRVVLAFDGDRVVGCINAISDGELAAFIPWLEVLPSHQRRGVGRELVRRLRADLDDHYSIDLICDPPLASFYGALGFEQLLGMGQRRPDVLGTAPRE